tara:strand:- start:259 stop:558 length:300 start_codon:yes stop_codon:yes gene_type:complete
VPAQPQPLPRHPTCTAPTQPQELEFIIYPDGRVEERVLGVKGADCQALTREINKALGEVYETEATSEMFEQKVEVNVEEENSNTVGWSSEGSGSSGSSW